MTTTAHTLDEYPITLGAKQVGEILCVSETTAYKLMRSKGFPTIRIGRRMIVPRDKLYLWINQQMPTYLQTEIQVQPTPANTTPPKPNDRSLAEALTRFLNQTGG